MNPREEQEPAGDPSRSREALSALTDAHPDALDAALTPQLRGLVDVFDGANHIFQCLIIASVEEGGELVCEFKRSTAVLDRPALDYWRDENAPVGYLPRA